MNTTTAAAEARVTAATIRTWCRRGVVTATKRAGRWIVDATSLAHRIAIGAMHARKKAKAVFHLDRSTSWRTPGAFTATGPADELRAAFESGEAITLAGDFEGDRVHLGITGETYGDYGRTLETIGEQARDGETATYVIDSSRLGDAPRLAALIEREQAEADAADARLAAHDDDYLNNYYE